MTPEENNKTKKLFFHSSAPWQQVILEDYLKEIKVNKEWSCLDLGCGLGNNLETILKFTPNITAVDILEEALNFCKNRYKDTKINFLLGDGQKLPFPNEIFNLIICTEVIEHSSSPERIVEESKRVLRNQGYLILSSQNYLNIAGLIKIFITVLLKKQDWDAWGTSGGNIENLITVSGIRRIIRTTGFKIVKEGGADYLNSWLIWLPFIYRNYKLLDKFPFFVLGKIPIIKRIGMDYFLLLQKV